MHSDTERCASAARPLRGGCANPARGARYVRGGYSLMEIVVVIAILGLAAAISTPSLLRLLERQKAETALRSVDRTLAAERVAAFETASPADAAALRTALAEALPEGWSVEVSPETGYDLSGWCPGGRIALEAPSGRRWTLALAEGDCRVERRV